MPKSEKPRNCAASFNALDPRLRARYGGSGRHRRADTAAGAAPQLAREQQEADHREAEEAQEGPVGDRAAEEGPVDLGAVAAAAEDHRDRALEREGLDHSVEVAAA